MLLLRPEDTLIGKKPALVSGYLRAVVRDSVFMGEYFRLEVLVGQTLLHVHSPRAFSIGDTMDITWSESALQCLPTVAQ